MDRYDPEQIEPKWQAVWDEEHTWEVSDEPDGRDKAYVLTMLPYPSGEPHIGHLKVYSVGDSIAHFRRRTGDRVLQPLGYDAFGLPAENHAIKTGQHPRESTEASITEFRQQLRRWGISIDWTREFGTHEPRYYHWTQWLFLRFFETRPGLSRRGRRELVPQGRDRAGERAGDRRPLRALRHPRREARPGAVVLPHHRLRRPPPRRPGDHRLAAPRGDDAAQLDRPLRGCNGELPLRPDGHRLPGVHHPPGHAVRGHLLRHGARAPGRAEAQRLARGGRVCAPHAHRDGGGARRRGPGEDGHRARRHGHQPG